MWTFSVHLECSWNYVERKSRFYDFSLMYIYMLGLGGLPNSYSPQGHKQENVAMDVGSLDFGVCAFSTLLLPGPLPSSVQ